MVMFDSFLITIIAFFKKGIGIYVLNDFPSGLENNAFSKGTMQPSVAQKKSPSGAETAGVLAPSQNISNFKDLNNSGVRSLTVIHILFIIPLPSTLSSVLLSPGIRLSNA